MDVLAQPVLVLNATYVPVAIRTVKDAIILLVLNKAELVKDEKALLIRSEKVRFTAPRIILLTGYYKVPKRKHKLSRENIFLRDNHECVYCRRKYPSSRLTLDHVIPKSRWNEIPKDKKPLDYHTWENLVTACRDCNSKKGNKLLHELKWEIPENRSTNKRRFPQFSVSEQLAEKFGWEDYIRS
ncbi:HNH endonuclease [Leptospira wolffii]|uniref:HNH endonuclease n=1 Tax=Leptospira wolffii TaxID=409998 RepID=A0A2M9ZDF7_9LEPT|nr:HNH endonuclease [Leptospira wolffii]EPG67659.1 HNH endonuclease domain protein [Leptospira wolffii serovar Khorat str. Khorat-H2]PJZ66468.1 HNH endonuclease [Leptospira wolffii]TGK59964.1 HNH endonuclease [Leptospira wolffii]TGK70046.1 HNH endonuclease [Leptospira wolffii]TGK75972.1 HNH endonuclease [Leptospira wolffii]